MLIWNNKHKIICLDCYFINVKLVKLLKEGFKRPVFCNEYQAKVETRNLDNNNLTRFPLQGSFQRVRRLFVFAFNNTTVTAPNNPINNTNNRVLQNRHTKYFLPRVHITNYNVLIDGRNFMISLLMTWKNSPARLERLQKDKEMITQQGIC